MTWGTTGTREEEEKEKSIGNGLLVSLTTIQLTLRKWVYLWPGEKRSWLIQLLSTRRTLSICRYSDLHCGGSTSSWLVAPVVLATCQYRRRHCLHNISRVHKDSMTIWQTADCPIDHEFHISLTFSLCGNNGTVDTNTVSPCRPKTWNCWSETII